jgi:hypothetical protein
VTFIKFEGMKRIESIVELKRESLYQEGKNMPEFFILLKGGLRSSKGIIYFPERNTFDIRNDIDDSYQEELTEAELENQTHIILAILNGALFKY